MTDQLTGVRSIIVDIEGTICPISFVKDELFPFFLDNLDAYLSQVTFPVNSNESTDDSELLQYLRRFPTEKLQSKAELEAYIRDLVARDIKDPALKALQGFIWKRGYDSGLISAPLFDDAISAIKRWGARKDIQLVVYSSGSVQAQKLLFAHVRNGGDMISCFDAFFDTTNAGPKTDAKSYIVISEKIGIPAKECLFLSDNILEVRAALKAEMKAILVVRPGNKPVEFDNGESESLTVLENGFDNLLP